MFSSNRHQSGISAHLLVGTPLQYDELATYNCRHSHISIYYLHSPRASIPTTPSSTGVLFFTAIRTPRHHPKIRPTIIPRVWVWVVNFFTVPLMDSPFTFSLASSPIPRRPVFLGLLGTLVSGILTSVPFFGSLPFAVWINVPKLAHAIPPTLLTLVQPV